MKIPNQFVCLQERAEGNSEVGQMWVQASTFPPTATLAEVWDWARQSMGRLMIRPDDAAGTMDSSPPSTPT